MMFIVLIVAATLYVVAAIWAVGRGGTGRLLATAVCATVALPLLGIGVGLWYAVPSVPRLVLHVVLLFAPMVLGVALALAPGRVRAAPLGVLVVIASAAAMAGLMLGVLVAVYGFSLVRS